MDGPIEADDSSDPLHQFLAVGLQQHALAFCGLVDHPIHDNLFPGFCLAHLEDGQNQTSILDDYSTTLCAVSSILAPDREHASLLGPRKLGLFFKGRFRCEKT